MIIKLDKYLFTIYLQSFVTWEACRRYISCIVQIHYEAVLFQTIYCTSLIYNISHTNKPVQIVMEQQFLSEITKFMLIFHKRCKRFSQ